MICEYTKCLETATVQYYKSEIDPYDGISTFTTDRCAKHPETDSSYSQAPLATRPTTLAVRHALDHLFGESIHSFLPALYDQTCPNCGRSEDETGHLPLDCQRGRCE